MSHLGMVCICDDERRARADARFEQARTILEAGSDNLTAHPVSDREFLTQAVLHLTWDHAVTIESILCDQWFAVTATQGYGDNATRLYVECDRVEDGIAFLITHLHANP